MIPILLRVVLAVVGARWFIRQLQRAFPPPAPPRQTHRDLDITYSELARYDAMAGITFQAGLAVCIGAIALFSVFPDRPELRIVLATGGLATGLISIFAAMSLRYGPRPGWDVERALSEKREQTLFTTVSLVIAVYVLLLASAFTYAVTEPDNNGSNADRSIQTHTAQEQKNIPGAGYAERDSG